MIPFSQSITTDCSYIARQSALLHGYAIPCQCQLCQMPMPTFANAKRQVCMLQVQPLGGKGLLLQRCEADTELIYNYKKLGNCIAMTLSKLNMR